MLMIRWRVARRVRHSRFGVPHIFWDILLSIFWFMLLFAWIWMLITILADIFRDHDLPGWRKAMWTLFIIVIPWLGALVYLVARTVDERADAHAGAAPGLRFPTVRAAGGGQFP
jgi:hypothetical protein